MKYLRAVIFGFVVAALLSCSKQQAEGLLQEEIQTKAPLTQDVVQLFSVSETDVINFIERMPSKKSIRTIDSIEKNAETMLYVVNYDDGWDVFSADKRMPPIVATSYHGTFPKDLHLHSSLEEGINWLISVIEKVKEDISLLDNDNTDIWSGRGIPDRIINNNSVQRDAPEVLWTKVKLSEQTVYYPSYILKGPYVETQWGQTTPWNSKLWNQYLSLYHPVGCVAVALSQLLYYYHYKIGVPSGLYHNITVLDWTLGNDYGAPCYKTILSRENYQDPSSRWSQMVKTPNEYVPSDSTSVLGASYVADLMADVGNRVNMNYFLNGVSSGSNLQRAYMALPYYGLTATTPSAFNYDIAISEIESQRPFFMQGFGQDNSAHAWVVDGYMRPAYVTTSRYKWYLGYLPGTHPEGECATQAEAMAAAIAAGLDRPDDEMETETQSISLSSAFFHMNWGWSGSYDDYYIATNIYIQKNNSIVEFNSDQTFFYNIRASNPE